MKWEAWHAKCIYTVYTLYLISRRKVSGAEKKLRFQTHHQVIAKLVKEDTYLEILVKFSNSKDKGKHLQFSHQWELVTYKGKRIRVASNFSSTKQEN